MSRKAIARKIWSPVLGGAMACMAAYGVIQTMQTPPSVNSAPGASSPQTTILKGKDGQTQIQLPPYWTDTWTADASPDTILRASHRRQDMHLVVSRKPRHASITLDQAAEISLAGQSRLQQVIVKRLPLRKVGPYPAIQHHVQGKLGSGPLLGMLVTVVQTPKYYYFLTTGSPATTFPIMRRELQQMVESFREGSPAAQPSSAP